MSEIPRRYQKHCDESRKAHLLAWQQSGLSMRKYCQTKGLSLSTFSEWHNKGLIKDTQLFAPLEVSPKKPEAQSPKQTLIVELQNGIKVTLTMTVHETKGVLTMLGGL